jgi:hypothetical protein
MITKIFLFISMSFSQNFTSRDDKLIVQEIVESFSKQCSYITTIESNIVRKLEEKLKLAQSENSEKALSCYRDNLTQITSSHYIYSNLCKEVNVPNFQADDPTYMRLFVTIQKYRKGIRLQHSILNDCLRSKRLNNKYSVDLEFNRIESDLLQEKLDKYKIGDKFTPNRTSYR